MIGKGSILQHIDAWGDGDVGEVPHRSVDEIGLRKPVLQYHCVGVGAGVQSEATRLKRDELLPKMLAFGPWSANALLNLATLRKEWSQATRAKIEALKIVVNKTLMAKHG